MTSPSHRLNMCKIASTRFEYIKACDIEISSNECSYTYLTMQKLNALYPEYTFYFIMGADSLDYYEKWCHPEIISSLCKILVVNRDEFSETDLKEKIRKINELFPADISLVHCRKYDISSTEIRAGKKLDNVLPEIKEYILKNHLYGL